MPPRQEQTASKMHRRVVTTRDFPFDFIIGTAARQIVNNTTTRVSISTLLPIKAANPSARTARRHANSLRIEHVAAFLTHLGRRFLTHVSGFSLCCRSSDPRKFGFSRNSIVVTGLNGLRGLYTVKILSICHKLLGKSGLVISMHKLPGSPGAPSALGGQASSTTLNPIRVPRLAMSLVWSP